MALHTHVTERVIIGFKARLLASRLPLGSELMASEYAGTRRDGSVQTHWE